MSDDAPDLIRLLLPELPCRIGVLDGENLRPQPVQVTLEIEVDLDTPARSDRFADTVDYGGVHARAVRLITSRRWNLVEALAGALVEAAFEDARVEGVRAVVRKCSPPLGDGAGPVEVVMRRRRNSP